MKRTDCLVRSLFLILSIMFSFTFVSCSDKDSPEPPKEILDGEITNYGYLPVMVDGEWVVAKEVTVTLSEDNVGAIDIITHEKYKFLENTRDIEYEVLSSERVSENDLLLMGILNKVSNHDIFVSYPVYRVRFRFKFLYDISDKQLVLSYYSFLDGFNHYMIDVRIVKSPR